MRTRIGIAAGAVLLSLASSAWATFHRWIPDEVYSNASGSIQFIEFTDLAAGEQFLTETFLSESTLSHSFTFLTDLPLPGVAGHDTNGQHFLIGTPGYDVLSGVPKADYVLPIDSFWSTTADTLFLEGTIVNHFTYSAGQLPTDGVHSLSFNGVSTFSVITNSPTNFAGQTGTVPVPEPATCGFLALGAAGLLKRRRYSGSCAR